MLQSKSPERPVVAQALHSLRSTFVGVGLFSMLINMLMLTGPIFMLQVYDRVLSSHSVPTLVVIGLLALLLYIFFGVLEGLRSRILMRMGQLIDARLSGVSYEVSTLSPLLLGSKAKKLRPVQDVDSVRQFVCGPGLAAILDMPWLPFYLGIVFLFHPLLGFIALGGVLFICLLIGLNELLSRKPAVESAQESAQRTALVEACRRNAEVIKAMGMMDAFKHRWNRNNDCYLDKQRFVADRANFYGSAIKTFRFVLQSIMLGVGAWLAIKQEISPGVMIATSIMSSRALAPVEQAVAHWRSFVAARQSLSRLKDVLDVKPDKEVLDLPLPGNRLELKAFACAPAGVRQPFVQNISFELLSGDGLGVIGPSGSGKSTLVRGIVGAMPTLKGSVRFDGADIDQWLPEKVGQFIGYLPQDVQLFDGSIAENISRFAVETEAEEVIKAAKLASVHDLIVTFPEGYNTLINNCGLSLSGGQRQRIALARALYKQPFLIVLDEPNSNLDSEGEISLTSAIKAMREMGSIVIVIAHRPSAILAVDTVLCMKEGKPTVIGPKNEIMKQVVSPVPGKEVA